VSFLGSEALWDTWGGASVDPACHILPNEQVTAGQLHTRILQAFSWTEVLELDTSLHVPPNRHLLLGSQVMLSASE
jgi:hypothetical protein